MRKLTNEAKHRIPGRKIGMVIDHVIPVRFCFTYDIEAEVCASEANLRWMDALDNLAKGSRITADSIAVMRKIGRHDLADVQVAKINYRLPR